MLAEDTNVTSETEKDDAAMEQEEEEEEDYASYFISHVIKQSPSPTSPLDLLEVDQCSSSASPNENDKVGRLMRLLKRHNKQVMELESSSSSSSNIGNDK